MNRPTKKPDDAMPAESIMPAIDSADGEIIKAAVIEPRPNRLGEAEHAEMVKQVDNVSLMALASVHEVIKTAQNLENLLLQNAARVKHEMSEHVALAGVVSSEAERLSSVITRLRNEQAGIAAEREKTHEQHFQN